MVRPHCGDATVASTDSLASLVGVGDAAWVSLQRFGESLWIAEGERIRMLGIPFGTRMTIVRLADGGMWLHSPIAARDELVAAVEALGPIRHIVAPNKFHHLFVGEWLERFPYATSWSGPRENGCWPGSSSAWS